MTVKRNNKLNNSVESPCIRNCCLNDDDICLGCFRHVDEIIEWGPADDQQRVCILEKVKQRIEKINSQPE